MISRVNELALSLVFTLALGSALTPLGCGASGGGSAVPARGDVEMPEGIARQVRTCAAQHLAHLGSGEQSIRLDVKLASDGQVDSVALRESTLGDDEVEVCMVRALRSLSADDLPMRRSENLPRDPAAPVSRALVGNHALAALAPISLAPVLITGIGIVVVVAVVIYIATDTDSDDDERERCEKVKDKCIEHCADTVLDRGIHEPEFSRCLRACMEQNSC